jgi:phage pi2 protein 07
MKTLILRQHELCVVLDKIEYIHLKELNVEIQFFMEDITIRLTNKNDAELLFNKLIEAIEAS